MSLPLLRRDVHRCRSKPGVFERGRLEVRDRVTRARERVEDPAAQRGLLLFVRRPVLVLLPEDLGYASVQEHREHRVVHDAAKEVVAVPLVGDRELCLPNELLDAVLGVHLDVPDDLLLEVSTEDILRELVDPVVLRRDDGVEVPALLQHAADLGERLLRVLDVLEKVEEDNIVEAVVRKRQALAVPAHERDVRATLFADLLRELALLLGDVDAGQIQVGIAFADARKDAAAAAAHLEELRAFVLALGQQLHQVAQFERRQVLAVFDTDRPEGLLFVDALVELRHRSPLLLKCHRAHEVLSAGWSHNLFFDAQIV
jgi:hypothetical protein